MADIREAFRRVARQPVFAMLVVVTLALGIGAAAAMFAVVHGVLLKPLPYANPQALAWMYGAFRASQTAAVSACGVEAPGANRRSCDTRANTRGVGRTIFAGRLRDRLGNR
jgi:putative ABC transport system permease protein